MAGILPPFKKRVKKIKDGYKKLTNTLGGKAKLSPYELKQSGLETLRKLRKKK